MLSFTDSVQAIGVTDINVKDLGVSMLSFSAHKFGGPKGVGVLYIKNGVKISPIITGGHQERAKRGGTSNVAGAVGLATALEKARRNLSEEVNRIRQLKEEFIRGVINEVPTAVVNGGEPSLPGVVNINFKRDGEALLYALDINGVCASLGAACSSGTIEPSHVLKEIGLSTEDAKYSLRFSFYKQNTLEEVKEAVKIIKKISER